LFVGIDDQRVALCQLPVALVVIAVIDRAAKELGV
jgi:hypothetical protein